MYRVHASGVRFAGTLHIDISESNPRTRMRSKLFLNTPGDLIRCSVCLIPPSQRRPRVYGRGRRAHGEAVLGNGPWGSRADHSCVVYKRTRYHLGFLFRSSTRSSSLFYTTTRGYRACRWQATRIMGAVLSYRFMHFFFRFFFFRNDA